MIQGHCHVCLVEPEIPQNTGAIGRLVAGAGCRLHLIPPFGFSADDRNLRRAGLDYWPFLDLEIHRDFEDFVAGYGFKKMAFLSKFGTKSYSEIPSDTEVFVFGSETKGLAASYHQRYADSLYAIPMFHGGVRSLNLANAVAVVVYDQLTRRGKTSQNGVAR